MSGKAGMLARFNTVVTLFGSVIWVGETETEDDADPLCAALALEREGELGERKLVIASQAYTSPGPWR